MCRHQADARQMRVRQTDLPDKQSENCACVSCANCPSCQSAACARRCRKTQIYSTFCAIPPRQEGRTRRHERGAGCDGRGWCRETYDIDASAKPCGTSAADLKFLQSCRESAT